MLIPQGWNPENLPAPDRSDKSTGTGWQTGLHSHNAVLLTKQAIHNPAVSARAGGLAKNGAGNQWREVLIQRREQPTSNLLPTMYI